VRMSVVGMGLLVVGVVFGVGGGLFARDILHYKDGGVVRVEVEEVTPDYVVFNEVDGTGVVSGGKRVIERGQVHFIEFGEDEVKEALAAGGGLGELEALRRLWHERRPSIAMPDSRAGVVGLRFAMVLLGTESEDNRKLAFDVFETVEERDWDYRRRAEARRGRFNALLFLGRMEEAMIEARAAAADPDAADPTLLVTAWLMMGDLAYRQLREIEEEHPRWMEDEVVRPVRNASFDDALDHYLAPFLYYGDHVEGAAEGLWNAVGVFEYGGMEEAALRRAEDLVFYYAGTEPGARGREWLAGRDREGGGQELVDPVAGGNMGAQASPGNDEEGLR